MVSPGTPALAPTPLILTPSLIIIIVIIPEPDPRVVGRLEVGIVVPAEVSASASTPRVVAATVVVVATTVTPVPLVSTLMSFKAPTPTLVDPAVPGTRGGGYLEEAALGNWNLLIAYVQISNVTKS